VLGDRPGGRAAAKSRRRIGFLPENVAFDDAMTGLELLRFYARLKRCVAAEANGLLDRVGLQAAGGARVRTYSRGMRQRLGLAQALLGEPQLLLLDEPTAGLDPASRQRFYEIIHDLSAAGVAVLLSSHLLIELTEHTDRILILDSGRLVASGTLPSLCRDAGLRLCIRVSAVDGCAVELAERLGVHPAIQQLDGGTISIRCLPDEKMDMLRRVTALGPLVGDIDITAPSLDDVYASVVGADVQACAP
jgi:Cu-processing system ATP-binding protein